MSKYERYKVDMKSGVRILVGGIYILLTCLLLFHGSTRNADAAHSFKITYPLDGAILTTPKFTVTVQYTISPPDTYVSVSGEMSLGIGPPGAVSALHYYDGSKAQPLHPGSGSLSFPIDLSPYKAGQFQLAAIVGGPGLQYAPVSPIIINYKPSQQPQPEPEPIKPGAIYVKSTPGDAEVWIGTKKYANTTFNGAPYGITDLKPGTYTVVIKKEGYKDYSTTIKLAANQIENVDAKLEPGLTATGWLKISSDPSGAKVVINGNDNGESPQTFQNVPPGTYSITLKKDGYEDYYDDAVKVTAGKITEINATLPPISGPVSTTAVLIASSAAALIALLGSLWSGMAQGGPTVPTGGTGVPGQSAAPPPVPTGPPALGTEIRGKVWYQYPGDEMGPCWMDKAKYLETRKMEAQGLTWSHRLGGWVSPEVKESSDRSIDEFQKQSMKDSREQNARIQKELDELKAKRELERAKETYQEGLKERQDSLERQRLKDEAEAKSAMKWYTPTYTIVKKTGDLTSREVFTGRDADGNFSWKSLVLRGLADAASGGAAELAYIPTDISYRTMDKVNRGQTYEEAIKEAQWEVGKETAIGYGIFRGVKGVYGVGSYLAKTPTSKYIADTIGRKIEPALAYAGEKLGPAITTAKQGLKDGVKWFGDKDEAFQNWQKGADGTASGGSAVPHPAGAPLPPKLADVKQRLDDVFKNTDPAKQAKALAKLYEGGGMKDLSDLQKLGEIPEEVAKKITATMRGETQRAVTEGTIKNIKQFPKDTGVQIKEFHLGNSGSTSQANLRKPGAGPGLKTDVDLTGVVKYEPTSLKNYANAHFGGNEAAAKEALNANFIRKNAEHVGTEIKNISGSGNLTSKDLDVNFYDGWGDASGRADAVPKSVILTNQAANGETQVFKVTGDDVRTYSTSGDAMTMEDALKKADYDPASRTYGGDPTALNTGQKMLREDMGKYLNYVKTNSPKAIGDLDNMSKFIERAHHALELAGKPGATPEVRALASIFHYNPSKLYPILANNPKELERVTRLFTEELEKLNKMIP